NKDNDALKHTVTALQDENARLKEEVRLHGRLKDILDYKDGAPFDTIAAGIVSLNIDQWSRTATINKGTESGIAKDMAVISRLGAVGRIISASAGASTVLLSTDIRSNIDVIVQRTRIKGVVEGLGSEGMTLKYVRQLDDAQVGDQIITSGLSGIFPKGLQVGEITRIEKGKDNFFKYIEVRPAADIQRLEEVLVVTGGVEVKSSYR
ncbi:MAG: rod shape-determining protein MreC, partial [Deltaproteobacteria bacterium]|nr:rod shape-determining protein MreC [Deltaproteobacteria bacterium]